MSGDVPTLSVRGLHTRFHTKLGVVKAVDDVSFDVNPGEVLGLVGESGSGKSVTALSLMRLIEREGGTIGSGQILFEG
ncbi:MAG: ATP-binding cassette domain-containing protein, partial [Hyphomicrobiales bacterium]|nr:ATP-binding cassette domain-containing protein [Hyphomicrobiales bacterium]